MHFESELDKQEETLNSLDRREFLRLAATGAIAVTGMIGCGSGGGGTAGGPGGGTALSFAQRQAVFNAIDSKIASLAGTDPNAREQELITYLRTRPEFEEVGQGRDGSIWGRFTDDRLYIIVANQGKDRSRDLLPRTTSRAAPAELPVPARARVFNALDSGFLSYVLSTDVTPEIRSMLAARGYTVTDGEGTIDQLKLVTGDGVFYLDAHGGWGEGRGGQEVFSIVSSTTVSEATDAALDLDWRSKRLAYCTVATDGLFYSSTSKYYGITTEFLKTYMSFGNEAIVFINACHSADPSSLDFLATMRGKISGVYVGWSHAAKMGDCNRAALYLFDRLLGANEVDPKENPPQRPFDYQSVKDDMTAKGLTQSNAASLQFVPGLRPGESGPLAPTIQYMEVHELAGQLILIGKFGARPPAAEGKVTVGGSERTIVSWEKEEIIVQIPETGAGSAGDVIVTNRGRRSNARQLTAWDITMQYEYRNPALVELKATGPISLRFRADVGSYRNAAGQAPVFPPYRFAIASRSSGTSQVASGSVQSGDCIIEWSGSARYAAAEHNPADKTILVARLRIDPKSRTGNLGMAFGSPSDGPLRNIISCPGHITNELLGLVFGGMDAVAEFESPTSKVSHPPIPLFSFAFQMANDFSIPGRSYASLGNLVKVSWSTTQPTAPPDPTAERSAHITK
jgi:hypothetical protein